MLLALTLSAWTVSLFAEPITPSTPVLAAKAISPKASNLSLEAFTAVYGMHTKGSEVAEITSQLIKLGKHRYHYRRETQAIGIFRFIRNTHIIEESFFTLVNGQIQPSQYRYSRSGHKPRQVAVRFNWDKQRAYNTLNGQTWDMPIDKGTIDKLSIDLALMLNAAKLAPSNPTISQNIADGGHAKIWNFQHLSEANTETDNGTYKTQVIERIRKDNKRHTEYSLAGKLAYLPVLIAHTEKDGSRIDIRLKQYRRNAGAE